MNNTSELGKYSKEAHLAVADQLSKSNIKGYLIGEEFSKVDLNSECLHVFRTKEDFLKAFNRDKIQNHTVLIKGSRGMSLEKIIDKVFQ